jgi:hypothetical protein
MDQFDNVEVFDRRAKPIVRQPIISIQKRGTFGLNKAAFEALGHPKAVMLVHAINNGQHVIGFRPTNRNSPRAYPVRAQARNSSFQVAGKAFCDHFGIPFGENKKFPATMVEGDLVVHLNQDD